MNLMESFKIPKFSNKFSVWETIAFMVSRTINNETFFRSLSNSADNLVRKLLNKLKLNVNKQY